MFRVGLHVDLVSRWLVVMHAYLH